MHRKMRSPGEVLCHIQWLTEEVLSHPLMFAGDAQAVEDVLILLDHLRDFITCSDVPNTFSMYHEFLIERGFCEQPFAAAMLARGDTSGEAAHSLIDQLCEFWREYLNWKKEREVKLREEKGREKKK